MNARVVTKLPVDIGAIHFVGIGGIGMSGIAEVLLNLGYQVQGSDLKPSVITRRLQDRGARIHIGQSEANLGDAEVVVISSAIKAGNPELDAARLRGLPVVRRAEMLAELMRLRSNVAVAGTHGKTTTTSLVAALLDGGGIDPTVINGGIIHAYGSNARLGDSDWMVVEADESDGTFTKLPATIAIVTNIDPEHLDHYGTFDAVRAAFDLFVSNIPFYGVAICCVDHPEVQSLVGRIHDRRVVTYGFNPQADVRITNLKYVAGRAHFDITFGNGDAPIAGLCLPMPGDHNVANAAAAIAVARHLGITGGEITRALLQFEGVNRRFTRVGVVNDVTIVDDYAHHPVEITAVLKAARQSTEGRVIAVHQPHRYSRLNDLFNDFCSAFNDADIVAITDIFAAGEAPIDGVDRQSFVTGLVAHGHKDARGIIGQEDLASFVAEVADPGDLVVCLGAGSISSWAHELPDGLAAIHPK